MNLDNHNEFNSYSNSEEQKVYFPIGLAFDGSKIPEGKWAPIKTLEEAAELTEAIKDQIKGLNDPLVDDDVYVVLRHHSIEEFCDVYQTLVNIAYAFGFTKSEIEDAYTKVVHNNNKRGRYNPDEYSEN